ncbi:MAG: MarR family transcriptional regulator [Devosia sp.]
MELPYRREQSAGYLTNWAARLFVRALERRLTGGGGGSGTMPVYFALNEGGALSQKALARWAAVEQPTMANTLDRMERDGLVSRAPDPDDGRSMLISLTPLGRERATESLTVARKVNALGLSALKPAEREPFLDMLGRIVAALEADKG